MMKLLLLLSALVVLSHASEWEDNFLADDFFEPDDYWVRGRFLSDDIPSSMESSMEDFLLCEDGHNCTNGSVCEDQTGDDYTCDCLPGYDGEFCEIDNRGCAHLPCENGASCDDSSGSFVCTCADGYEGQTCDVDINECDGVTCQNGGSCVDEINGYTCDCADGYEGDHCETDINECASNPCLNGGTCTDLVNDFSCDCGDTGYVGDTCDNNTCENWDSDAYSCDSDQTYESDAICVECNQEQCCSYSLETAVVELATTTFKTVEELQAIEEEVLASIDESIEVEDTVVTIDAVIEFKVHVGSSSSRRTLTTSEDIYDLLLNDGIVEDADLITVLFVAPHYIVRVKQLDLQQDVVVDDIKSEINQAFAQSENFQDYAVDPDEEAVTEYKINVEVQARAPVADIEEAVEEAEETIAEDNEDLEIAEPEEMELPEDIEDESPVTTGIVIAFCVLFIIGAVVFICMCVNKMQHDATSKRVEDEKETVFVELTQKSMV